MSLKKIEEALKVLGYEGTVVGFDLASEEGYCTVKLKISPSAITIDIPDKAKTNLMKSFAYNKVYDQKVVESVEEPKLTPFELFCRNYKESQENSGEGTDDEKKEINSRWKTPTPRTAMRYVYFKKEKQAKDFAKEYEKDFEYAASQTLGKDSIQPYKIRKNHSDNDLYAKGYMWSLEFRMNGKDFQVLEQCENLKKKSTGNRAGHCVRYKED